MRCLRGVKTNEDLHRFGDTTTAFSSMQSCGESRVRARYCVHANVSVWGVCDTPFGGLVITYFRGHERRGRTHSSFETDPKLKSAAGIGANGGECDHCGNVPGCRLSTTFSSRYPPSEQRNHSPFRKCLPSRYATSELVRSKIQLWNSLLAMVQ